MHLEDFDTGERYTATVLDNFRITSDESCDEVREITLELTSSSFDYEIGQSIGVIVPGCSEIGHQHHFRMYSIADTRHHNEQGNPVLKICVKRCSYIDQYSGEEFKGIASHYLCGVGEGDNLTINGPFGQPFAVPKDKDADLILVGMGTGIAPFRALVRHLYQNVTGWRGQVRLFYGAKSGLELFYMNDHKDDFAQYYDEDTFEAFKALSTRPAWNDAADIGNAIEQRATEVLKILQSKKGYIYIAGRLNIQETLDKVFSRLIGSAENWQDLKSQLIDQKRWLELIY